MSKSDLKAAMESLQVKKPLKLQERQPQFRVPPIIPEATLVPAETQVDPRTQVAVATEVPLQTTVPETTQVAAPTEVAQTTPVSVETSVAAKTQVAPATQVHTETTVAPQTRVAIETLVPAPTQVDVSTPVAAQTEVAPQTQVPERTKVGSDGETTRSASDQDSSVTLEEQSAPKLHQGYTRLPNSFLMRMASGDLLRSEMQILLLIARFTISFQKRLAPLSKAVLERQSGLRGPAVLQAISELQAKGLIEKIPGDQHRPNQLGLIFDDEWEFFSKPKATNTLVPAETQVAAAAMVPAATPVVIATTAPVATPTPAVVPPATYFKDIKTIKKNNALSHLPESLQKYFGELKPAKKRESESMAFQELKQDFSEEQIEISLRHLLQQGMIGSGEACHSPMAYLAKAIGQVLPEAQVSLEKRRKAESRAIEIAEDGNKKREQELEAERETAERERAFHEAFPTREAQLELIQRYAVRFPMLGSAGPIVRNLAIGAWHEEHLHSK